MRWLPTRQFPTRRFRMGRLPAAFPAVAPSGVPSGGPSGAGAAARAPALAANLARAANLGTAATLRTAATLATVLAVILCLAPPLSRASDDSAALDSAAAADGPARAESPAVSDAQAASEGPAAPGAPVAADGPSVSDGLVAPEGPATDRGLALPRGPVGRSGHASRDEVLLGMHFLHSNLDCNAKTGGMEDVIPGFLDYARWMPEDLEHMSYADFWHWWYEFERYKGDEKGLGEMDAIVDACLARGLKVKIDLAWSTWWTEDLDWEADPRLARGPGDIDDWAHLCELLGHRYRGRIALWLLQGEANDLKGYWQGRPIEHVHEVYRIGSMAFKRADPGVLISVAGASPSVPKEALDEWVRSNVAALRGHFDDVSMNFFADVADPYRGIGNYYSSIRRILDEHGETRAEVGSGESSFQWAETSENIPKDPPRSLDGVDPEKLPLCELKQAWRLNQSLGTFFALGGNKFVLWGTEYAPGGGWPWRWGFRKYQDWWGTWPESHVIAGTNIVYRFDAPGGRSYDLRPGWSSRPTDPYHPMWHVYRFWAGATPPGGEAVRVPAEVRGAPPGVRSLATYLRARDACVVLVQSDAPAGGEVVVDLGRTAWGDGASLDVRASTDWIEYGTGDRRTTSCGAFSTLLEGGKARIPLEVRRGFTTLRISRASPRLAAEAVLARATEAAVVGRPVRAVVAVRNTGSSLWRAGSVSAAPDSAADGAAFALPVDVEPGREAAVAIDLPAPEGAGHVAYPLRLRDSAAGPFGPVFFVSVRAVDPLAPRKLVAHRAAGAVKVQWFPPWGAGPGDARAARAYELWRADSFDGPAKLVATVEGLEWIDRDPPGDRSRWYHVVAVDREGNRSRPSPRDNARPTGSPRLWDAEVVTHDVPGTAILGDPRTVSLTLKNTGTKAWDLGRRDLRFAWAATRLWGEEDEAKLPRVNLGASGKVEPEATVTLSLPYVGPKEGRFENHWILTLESPTGKRAYFGAPLLVETAVTGSR